MVKAKKYQLSNSQKATAKAIAKQTGDYGIARTPAVIGGIKYSATEAFYFRFKEKVSQRDLEKALKALRKKTHRRIWNSIPTLTQLKESWENQKLAAKYNTVLKMDEVASKLCEAKVKANETAMQRFRRDLEKAKKQKRQTQKAKSLISAEKKIKSKIKEQIEQMCSVCGGDVKDTYITTDGIVDKVFNKTDVYTISIHGQYIGDRKGSLDMRTEVAKKYDAKQELWLNAKTKAEAKQAEEEMNKLYQKKEMEKKFPSMIKPHEYARLQYDCGIKIRETINKMSGVLFYSANSYIEPVDHYDIGDSWTLSFLSRFRHNTFSSSMQYVDAGSAIPKSWLLMYKAEVCFLTAQYTQVSKKYYRKTAEIKKFEKEIEKLKKELKKIS